ncbi:NAC domain-containing protein 90 [Manihot esculenta]|uniref:NAC transcription factors 80 n=2 Tax=Manihot esculenta TaxID=3983 RepID=A0A0M5JKG8_MANES|nr:NAC domain-containing protein 90 [Manihot esculenta]ALC79057.1 NAC transcription factors 80 [Manihot esculenta]KAG8647009.1 hypothetical protein MANES_09G052600v8 [Manihot esculenta]
MELAIGFRFYPTEEELISFYLHNKLQDKREDDLIQAIDRVVAVLDIYDFDPWQLPRELCRRDPEQWFFFVPRQEREAKGGKPKRLTPCGYWKSTGSAGYVYSSNNSCIGAIRTMAFYKGRVPNGRKTQWKMNEYKATEAAAVSCSSSTGAHPRLRKEFSLCRVYKKSAKRLRTFGRRPSATERGESGARQVHSEEGRTIHESPPMLDRRSSPSFSQHNDGYLPQRAGDQSNTAVALSNEPLWDWDHLYHWYHDGKDMHPMK